MALLEILSLINQAIKDSDGFWSLIANILKAFVPQEQAGLQAPQASSAEYSEQPKFVSEVPENGQNN